MTKIIFNTGRGEISISRIIWFRGKSGVGKTFISNRVSKKFNIPVIRKDDAFDSLVDYIEDIPARHEASFKLLNKFIDTSIMNNSDLIIDCPLHHNDRLIELINRYKSNDAILKPVLVICTDQKLWADRFNIRRIDPSPNQIITDFDEMMNHYEQRDIITKAIENELVIDSANDIELIMELIESYIKDK